MEGRSSTRKENLAPRMLLKPRAVCMARPAPTPALYAYSARCLSEGVLEMYIQWGIGSLRTAPVFKIQNTQQLRDKPTRNL